MITVQVRKQGGAAIITIPSDVLKMLDIEIGEKLELDVMKEGFLVKHIKSIPRGRYTITELLHGISKEDIKKLNKETKWAREGKSVGREIT